jgi:hypothetical protein
MLSPRALFGVAPALIVFVGSFVLSRQSVRDSVLETADGAVEPSRSETIVWPTAEDEDRLHRVALKQETVDDLLEGRLTLTEAIERFESLTTSDEAISNLRVSGGGETDAERTRNQLMAYARVRVAMEPKRFEAALARLEASTKSSITPLRLSN